MFAFVERKVLAILYLLFVKIHISFTKVMWNPHELDPLEL